MVPKPRGTAKEGGGGGGEGGGREGEGGRGFQRYVKDNYKRVREDMEKAGTGKGGIGMGEVMGVLGREWRKRKGNGVVGTEKAEETVATVAEKMNAEEEDDNAGLEHVARKLNFLHLSAEE